MRRFEPDLKTDEHRAGQLLFVGIEGTRLTGDLRSRLEGVCPGGIILFARNLVDSSQVAEFCREISGCLPVPPFLAIDQEGGRVSRLAGILPPIPDNLALARSREPLRGVEEHARQTGRALSLLGFNLNFAPVFDLSDETMPNGIGNRSYGEDPDTVTRLARVFLETQDRERVSGCGKHFPGLGGGRVDSHQDLPVIEHDAERLWERDLLPYRVLRGVTPMVMVGHAYYPALQGPQPRPATLSPEIVTGLLRDRIGYGGVVLTDDLEMGAVDQSRPAGEIVLEALDAGSDLVMYCKSWDRIEAAHAALTKAIRNGRVPASRLEASLTRILSWKRRLPGSDRGPAFDPVRFAEVRAGFERLAQAIRV
jgi:beta-N-acetylhexosaminidase